MHDITERVYTHKVSLFTREWIEIVGFIDLLVPADVSLFTREWIEIQTTFDSVTTYSVSLFTREWIEIENVGVTL